MLRPKKKLTKKEIKKDPVLEAIAKAEVFLRSKGKYVTYALIGIFIVIMVIFLVIRSKHQANYEAKGELGLAELSIVREDYDDAIVKLNKLIDNYDGTKAGGIATLLLAQCYFYKSDFDNAYLFYKKFIDKYKFDRFLTACAYNGMGIVEESRGNYELAASYYKKATDISPYEFQRHEYLLNYADILIKLKQYDEAEKILSKLLEENLEKNNKDRAEVLLGKIKSAV